MSKKLIQIRQNSPTLQLTWIINNICTNKCDYCPPSLNSGTNHHYEWDKAKSFIERLIKRYSKIHCSIGGGEPTISPFFPDLVHMFYNAGHTVGITSNGARSIRYIEEISPYLSYICFSYHPQYDDKDFIEKALAATKNCHVSLRIMMHDKYWDKAKSMYEKCLTFEEFRVEPVKILSEMAGRNIGNNYSAEQLKWLEENTGRHALTHPFKDNPLYRPSSTKSDFFYDDGSIDYSGDTNHLISTGQNDYRGWACNIGLESLFIFADGWVKKANCFQGGQLFHINDHESYELPTTAEICCQHICHCGTDVMITKFPVLSPSDPLIVNNLDSNTPISNPTYNSKNHKKYKTERIKIFDFDK